MSKEQKKKSATVDVKPENKRITSKSDKNKKTVAPVSAPIIKENKKPSKKALKTTTKVKTDKVLTKEKIKTKEGSKEKKITSTKEKRKLGDKKAPSPVVEPKKKQKTNDKKSIPTIQKPKKKEHTKEVSKRLASNNKTKPDTFRFRAFYKRTEDKKSIEVKSKKIAGSITRLLNSRSFLKTIGIINPINTSEKESSKPVNSPVKFRYECNFEKKDTDFVIRGTGMDQKTLGNIIQAIQERFFEAERKGLCKYFVYVFNDC